jgi:myo-inositol-1-phosphate synthase
MSGEIRIAIAGVGNCASSLVQGLEYYKSITENDTLVPGLMHNVINGYMIRDIKVVAAFDVNKEKVGKDVSKAIFAHPNCALKFSKVPKVGTNVQQAPVMDGLGTYLTQVIDVDEEKEPVDVAEVLRDCEAEMLINYLPVGSRQATEFYAQQAIDAKCGFINAIPEFIASKRPWVKKFKEAGLPVAGDDIKSQLGATIIHRILTYIGVKRGIKIKNSYQLNIGGNTDFYNMLDRNRLESKRISKTDAVQSQVPYDVSFHIEPSGYVDFLNDNKICYLTIEGTNFGDAPVKIDLKLSVEDSPNSGGVMIDAVRIMRLALDQEIRGCLKGISSYFFKHPYKQYSDNKAMKKVEKFIKKAAKPKPEIPAPRLESKFSRQTKT